MLDRIQLLPLGERARALRQGFDAAFALPPAAAEKATAALLLVRAGAELLALHRAETTGLVRAENIAWSPARSPAFLGLASQRGELYPVWSLARLLGRPSPESSGLGWLVLTEARGGAPCAFFCEGFERMILVNPDVLTKAIRHEASAGLSAAMVPWESSLVPVADLPALHTEISRFKTQS